MALADNCPQLEEVYFNGCCNLTDVGLLSLVAKCPKLGHARFYRCGDITDAAKASAQKMLPGCDFVF